MKKILIAVLIIINMFCGCSNENNLSNKSPVQPYDNAQYVKAVWITYYELSDMIGKRSENEFKKKADEVFKELYNMGFNTVCVQVRAFADAFYKSKYFPTSAYCFGKQGSELKFDVLKILCETASENKIAIEAWLNPYRISFDSDIEKLSDDNIAKKWYKSKKKKSNVYICKGGIYFNPASDEVIKLIVNGAAEIAENYNISAIHFDDYFYPAKDKAIDSAEFEKYAENGGKKSLSAFRREKVSNMIKSVYEGVKKANPEIRFGISPAANIKNDYNDLYADVEAWAREDEYCDYICPQVYFGFKNEKQPFMFTVNKWLEFTSINLYIGLPLYKCGKKDEYASASDESAIKEFIESKNIIARQINYLAKIDDIKGFYVFSYSSLKDENNREEVENLIKAIQSTHPN